MRTEPERALLSAGRNGWRVERAERVALLIGAPAYFNALRQSLLAARAAVRIVGWHLDAATELGTEDGAQSFAEASYPSSLGALLQAVTQRERRLRSFVLDWDYSMLYSVDRDLRRGWREPWKLHRRLHFCLDGTEAVGAAPHEKIVVVDDAVAFAGGIDLCSPPAVATPAATGVQLALQGPAAAALAEHARWRWQQAVGRAPGFVSTPGAAAPWPARLQADFETVDVAIVHTAAAESGRPAVMALQQLLVDAIGAAQQRLYIEAQTLSAVAIADALAAALQRESGPEVVIVTPLNSEGWLDPIEQLTRRAQLLRQLQDSDRHGRLQVLYPVCDPGSGKSEIPLALVGLTVVVDERLLIVGSADATNRSLQLDTECCLAIEATGVQAARVSAAIGRCRDRVLATHLGVAPDAVTAALASGATLRSVIRQMSGQLSGQSSAPVSAPLRDGLHPSSRGLRTLPPPPPGPAGRADATVERLISIDAMTALLRAGGGASSSRGRAIAITAVVLLVLGATAAWRWTPLSELVNVDRLASMARTVADTPLAPLWVLGTFMAGSLIAIPITLLIVATSLVFSTGWALVYALAGSLAAAALNFGLGRWVGGGFVSRIGGERWNRLNQRLSQSGVLAVLALRIVPVAPFLVVNLAAGASKLRFRDFMIGSLLGMAPGVLTITVFSGLVTRLLHQPSPKSIATLVGGAAVLLGLGWVLQRLVRSRNGPKP
ncbi:MAG: VTT domain-containing protein [Pseudomonadota bacterium]|nr:VTT domain-containing protein [Pseudomonadota bacterium]